MMVLMLLLFGVEMYASLSDGSVMMAMKKVLVVIIPGAMVPSVLLVIILVKYDLEKC